MTRQEANFKIVDILKSKGYYVIAEDFEELAEMYPQQRAGQIFCNYIFPSYREESIPFMEEIFNIKYDPFYEESTETLSRLCKSTLE